MGWFLIPMRGSESRSRMISIVMVMSFLIPMRGSEVRGFIVLVLKLEAPDPHEG